MEDLFDDILLDDNDATSAFNNVAVASLSNLVNDNLNYLKFNSYINNDNNIIQYKIITLK